MSPLLLHHIDLISRCRKRGEIEAAVVAGIHLCLNARRTELYKIYMPTGDVLVGLAAEFEEGRVVAHDDGFSWPEHTGSIENAPFLQECFGADTPQITRLPDGRVRLVLMLRNHQHEPFGFLAVLRDQDLSDAELGTVRGMARLMMNNLALLEYGETDTLTRLLNRKTFDEYLMNILASIPAPDAPPAGTRLPQRRQAQPVARDHWLGVMDIDHLKSINDRFGRLIGDEVLILTANLMRDCFRVQDKLFRFGGEEFVALLRPVEFAHARRTFERFRAQVERYVFPQVGHVTISIGFARIRLGDTASRILDSADEALYWAKEHGRNQCHAYETLTAAGKLTRPVAPVSAVVLF